MNVSTVRSRMFLVIDMMKNHGVDVMAIQETRLKNKLEPGRVGQLADAPGLSSHVEGDTVFFR